MLSRMRSDGDAAGGSQSCCVVGSSVLLQRLKRRLSWSPSSRGGSVSSLSGIHYPDVSSPHLSEIFIPVWMRAKQESRALNMNKWINEGVSKGCRSCSIWKGFIENVNISTRWPHLLVHCGQISFHPLRLKFYMCQLISGTLCWA